MIQSSGRGCSCNSSCRFLHFLVLHGEGCRPPAPPLLCTDPQQMAPPAHAGGANWGLWGGPG
eukprot:3569364-Alexandrium_andersonii.AAC.1